MNQKRLKIADAPAGSDRVGTIADVSMRLGLTAPAVPAAWPTGVSQLAQAIEACQSCDTAVVRTDWLARAPSVFKTPPAFCTNADGLARAKDPKKTNKKN